MSHKLLQVVSPLRWMHYQGSVPAVENSVEPDGLSVHKDKNCYAQCYHCKEAKEVLDWPASIPLRYSQAMHCEENLKTLLTHFRVHPSPEASDCQSALQLEQILALLTLIVIVKKNGTKADIVGCSLMFSVYAVITIWLFGPFISSLGISYIHRVCCASTQATLTHSCLCVGNSKCCYCCDYQ